MQSSSRILSAGASLACAALTSPAAAHHPFPAFYDIDTTREIQGWRPKSGFICSHLPLVDGEPVVVRPVFGSYPFGSRSKIRFDGRHQADAVRQLARFAEGYSVMERDVFSGLVSVLLQL